MTQETETPQESQAPKRTRLVVRGLLTVFLFVGLGGLLTVLAFEKPTDGSFYPRCLSNLITGFHCPGCGITRALHAALNGNFEQALAYNVLAPLIAPLFFYELLKGLLQWIWNVKTSLKPPSRWKSRALWGFMILMVCYGIIRNLPFEPFNWLAPHELPPG